MKAPEIEAPKIEGFELIQNGAWDMAIEYKLDAYASRYFYYKKLPAPAKSNEELVNDLLSEIGIGDEPFYQRPEFYKLLFDFIDQKIAAIGEGK